MELFPWKRGKQNRFLKNLNFSTSYSTFQLILKRAIKSNMLHADSDFCYELHAAFDLLLCLAAVSKTLKLGVGKEMKAKWRGWDNTEVMKIR